MARNLSATCETYLALQDELARDIAEEVRIKVTPEEQSRVTAARTVKPQAYDAYLRGRYLWLQRNPGAIASAIEYFSSKPHVKTHPSLLPIPDSPIAIGSDGEQRWIIHSPSSTRAELISLQPDLAEGHTSLGALFLYEHQMADAQKELRRAIELNPNYAIAHHYYALYLESMGLPADALAENERARQLGSFSPYRLTPFAQRF